jgi:hypothetical protein
MGLPHPWKVLTDPEPGTPDWDHSDYLKHGYLYDYDKGRTFRLYSDTPSEQSPGLYHREADDHPGEPPRIRAQDMRRLLDNKPADPTNPFEGHDPMGALIERLNAYRQDARDANRARDFY